MSQNEMSFAQALTEARQLMLQQSARIKSDAEKIKSQQQTIVDQSATISDQDRRLKDQAADLERQAIELRSLSLQLEEVSKAQEQSEGVINRQGERIRTLDASVEEMERRLDEARGEINGLVAERDELRGILPTQEDSDALQAMTSLLTRKASAKAAREGSASGTMRIAGETEASEPVAHAQAA